MLQVILQSGIRLLRHQSLGWGLSFLAALSPSGTYAANGKGTTRLPSQNHASDPHWDDGIPGLIFDYTANAQLQRQRDEGIDYSFSGNGTTGANIGAWRLRADWQGSLERKAYFGMDASHSLDISRYYAYRAIPAWRAKLTLGENYLDSSIFDSFRFAGVTLLSDDSMLPSTLRDAVPDVAGIARTNAKVTIKQQGRVLYETQVKPGPFRIQGINGAVAGELNVRVEEQDGSVQLFSVNSAGSPYLTRGGDIRFKLAAGKPSAWEHYLQDPPFSAGEVSWGVGNGWSLYSGMIVAGDYSALSLGAGREFAHLGALSLDMTRAQAYLPADNETLRGNAIRARYTKSFDDLDSQISFTGYQFMDQDYMGMSDYLDSRVWGFRISGNKAMEVLSVSKQFRELGLSISLSYNYQSYWDSPSSDRYTLQVSRDFDLGGLKDLNLSVSAYRNTYAGANDEGMYVSISIPLQSNGYISQSLAIEQGKASHRIEYADDIDENNSYLITAGHSRSQSSLGGYYDHEGDIVSLNANVDLQEGQYAAVGFSAQGGATLTPQGGAFHRVDVPGSTRLLFDSRRDVGTPFYEESHAIPGNRWGKAVIADVPDYQPLRVGIGKSKIQEPDVTQWQNALSEGAIGYRPFDTPPTRENNGDEGSTRGN